MAAASHARVTKRRANLRAAGFRPVQIWVPDTRAPGFAAECRRQATRVARADHADDELGASSLSIGVPTRGVVDAAGDRDLFRLELYGATPVRLEVESSDVLACSLRWPDGSEEPMPACLVEQDLAPGRYHVVVTSDVAHARYTVRASRSGAL